MPKTMASSPTPEECSHPYGWEYDDSKGERWEAATPDDIPAEVTQRWCGTCGELRFRVDNGWKQRYWSAEELEQIKENAKKYDRFFDDD